MIITRTPFRVSFVGGGTDLESFYRKHTGAVISTTIDKYMYISSHKFFEEDKVRAKYSQTETVQDINNLKHPIIREVLKKFNIKGGIEISSIADIPGGTGLGSSSSFTIGLLHNFYTTQGKFVTKEQLAEEACDIEINRLQEPIGKQDQYIAAFGGLNLIKFNTNGAINVEPIHLKFSTYKNLQKRLLLFYIGNQRKSSDILTEQKNNIQNKINFLKEMVKLVWKLRDSLYEDNLYRFGQILHENWLLKKKLASGITNTQIDEIYNKAIENGAIGGKILGAGGGGFMLFYCEEENQEKLKSSLSFFKEVKFQFENEGSKIIYVGDEYGQKYDK